MIIINDNFEDNEKDNVIIMLEMISMRKMQMIKK